MILLNRRALSTLQKIVVAVFLIAVIGGVAYGLGLFNQPPKAAFTYRTPTRTLKHIAPTDRDLIIFTNESTDPETPLDKLISNWYVRHNGTGEWKLLNSSTHHWGRLPVSNEKGHEIKLVVSDGMREDTALAVLPVDAHRRYLAKKVRIPMKGMVYGIGREFIGDYGTAPSRDEMAESLTVLRDELGCNAIKIIGGHESVMLACAELAIENGFKEIMISPRYEKTGPGKDIMLSEHKERVVKLAKRIEELRTKSAAVVYCTGDELMISAIGITSSKTYEERVKEIAGRWANEENVKKLNDYLRETMILARNDFKGPITYSAALSETENVEWRQLGFDIAGAHLYRYAGYSRDRMLRRISLLRSFGLPVRITEFGCSTYAGASNLGPDGWSKYTNQSYSQEEQAQNIVESMEIFEAGEVGGVYLHEFLERTLIDAKAFAIMRWNGAGKMITRKLGFYAYQSFIST